jgi:S-DNA-T family DNA segregation ATPase FtsK/SpoIIIE
LKSNTDGSSYDDEIVNQVNNAASASSGISISSGGDANGKDTYFIEAGKFIIEKEKASIGMLQRVFKIGFNRAARIMDQLCEAGVVGPEEGTKPRKVLMSMEEFEQYIEEYNC